MQLSTVFKAIYDYNQRDDIVGWPSEGQVHAPSVNEASRNVIVFHINTTNNRDLQVVKEGLIERIADMVDDFTIKNEAITLLDDSTIATIRALQTPDVAIDIGKSKVIKSNDLRLITNRQNAVCLQAECERLIANYYWSRI